MDFWASVVFGIIPFSVFWTGVKIMLGHPLVPFGLILMSLWCSVIAAGIINVFVCIKEIREENHEWNTTRN